MYGSLLHRVCADPWSALRSAVMVLVLACSMGFDAAAAEAGATAIIQPGGSIRDEDVIKAADEAGLAMVFTGMRHFRH